MKAYSDRVALSCLVCILLNGVSPPAGVSQESKPDEPAKKNILRAGVNGIGSPVCIHCPQPGYSKKARADKLEGSVLLDIMVTAEGETTDIILLRSLGDGLDEKAIEAVKSWKLKPAKNVAGNPVAARVQVEITFHLFK